MKNYTNIFPSARNLNKKINNLHISYGEIPVIVKEVELHSVLSSFISKPPLSRKEVRNIFNHTKLQSHSKGLPERFLKIKSKFKVNMCFRSNLTDAYHYHILNHLC